VEIGGERARKTVTVNPPPTSAVLEARRMVGLLHEAAFAFSRTTRRITAWNAHAQAIFGFSEAQALALDVEALLVPETPFEAIRMLEGHARLGLCRPDGALVPAQLSFSPLGESAEGMVLAIARKEEPAVPAREILFRSVFERAATGIALTDLNGHFLECNEAFQNLVGFKQRELRHLNFDALSHPADRAKDSAAFRDLLEGRRDFYDVTQRMVHKEGSVIWIHATLSLVKDAADQPLYCIALINDITEERHASQRAAIQLTMTRLLAENPPTNLAIVQVMQAICKTLDWQFGEYWTPDEGELTLRRQVSWQVPGFVAAEFTMIGEAVTMNAGEGLPGKVWHERRPAWFSDVLRESNFLRKRMAEQAGIKGALAFPVSSPTGMLGVMVFAYRDFRHPDQNLLAMMAECGAQLGQFIVRKQAERQLKLLGAIVHSAGEAIVGTDLLGTITSWNPSAQRLFGYSAEEAVGKPFVSLFPHDRLAALVEAMDRVRLGAPTPRLELVTLSKFETMHEVWVTLSRITDEGGAAAGFSMTVYDVSNR
jgi:PAS domain S-box-containing protein